MKNYSIKLLNKTISFWYYGKYFNLNNLGVKHFESHYFNFIKILFIFGHIQIAWSKQRK
jgi:hypothetical protein